MFEVAVCQLLLFPSPFAERGRCREAAGACPERSRGMRSQFISKRSQSMTTRKQRAATRRNAKKSTGPKTPEGKAKSAQNATKHGLLSGRPVLADEDPAAYEEHRLPLLHELWPETPLEKKIVERHVS